MRKDKPILAPLWILDPSKYLTAESFPYQFAIPWWVLTMALGWLEPLPPELDLKFSSTYLLWSHFFGILGLLLPPLGLAFLTGGRSWSDRVHLGLRLGMGASFWYLWTFPLAFVGQGIGQAVALMLLRPALWAITIGWTMGPQLPLSRRGGILRLTWILPLLVTTFVIQSGRDLGDLSQMKMDDVRTGRVSGSTSSLGDSLVDSARWELALQSPLSLDRLNLGRRQEARFLPSGAIEVVVRYTKLPPPVDTGNTLDLSLAQGTLMDRMVARVPSGGTELQRLLILHQLVHSNIKYERTYFTATPEAILEQRKGDCKSFASVFCHLARRLGFRAKVVRGLVAMRGTGPEAGFYAHAWVTVSTANGWIDLDPTASFPFPDAGYLRFSMPEELESAFDGENKIFNLKSIQAQRLGQASQQVPFRP